MHSPIEMEDRINQLISEEDAGADTFADRAEAYYRRRPRLMALLHDLYNEYVSLTDRYARALTKLTHAAHSSPITPPTPVTSFSVNNDDSCFSDAESTLSYQPTFHSTPPSVTSCKRYRSRIIAPSSVDGGVDMVAELVMKSVEYDFLQQEMEVAARESSRKIELQKSLLEVLESERMVLLGENSRLGYKAEMLAEEKKAAEAENVFLKQRANQLARCVMRYQEDRRTAVLGRQIEDLQRQIYALERKNYENVTPPQASVGRREEEKNKKKLRWWWSRLKKIGVVNPCGSCSTPVHVIQL